MRGRNSSKEVMKPSLWFCCCGGSGEAKKYRAWLHLRCHPPFFLELILSTPPPPAPRSSHVPPHQKIPSQFHSSPLTPTRTSNMAQKERGLNMLPCQLIANVFGPAARVVVLEYQKRTTNRIANKCVNSE